MREKCQFKGTLLLELADGDSTRQRLNIKNEQAHTPLDTDKPNCCS